MFCEQCGGQYKRTENEYCPYCGVKAPPVTGNAPSVVSKDDEKATVKAILKVSHNLLSPATESTFIINIDDGMYRIKLEVLETDSENDIRIPYGHHKAVLEFYSYDDKTLSNPEIDKRNNIKFDVDANRNVLFTVQPGTLIKPKTLSVEYV